MKPEKLEAQTPRKETQARPQQMALSKKQFWAHLWHTFFPTRKTQNLN